MAVNVMYRPVHEACVVNLMCSSQLSGLILEPD